MAIHSCPTVDVFDKYRFTLPPGLKWHRDGQAGSRVLFITDSKERFIVSFEEEMQTMNMPDDSSAETATVCFQHCRDGKYIHLKRNSVGRISHAFFYIELQDDDGTRLHLSGQMVVTPDYQWSDGIEPVLMQLLEGVSLTSCA